MASSPHAANRENEPLMPSFSTISAIRFGTGLSPQFTAPQTAEDILAGLAAPDEGARAFPVSPFSERLSLAQEFRKARSASRSMGEGAKEAFRQIRIRQRELNLSDSMNTLARAVYTPHGFRDRLAMFWADHFTTRARNAFSRGIVTAYSADAIRPNVAGSFATLLKAAVLHPAMLQYLDQPSSFGPNSELGKRRGRGLNENLAREVIELHTLGVDGAYGQEDVRQLAELFTGLSVNFTKGTFFRRKMAEPGAETVLGKRYGGMKPRMSDIEEALDDLALHPDTARHLARKLAGHFTSDDPAPGLVEDVAAAYTASGGDLTATYHALLDHFDSWDLFGAKARRADEFIIATLRALDVPAPMFTALTRKPAAQYIFGPMAAMGQPWEEPKGPDGWPEHERAWINPQALAARIQWAMVAPRALSPGTLEPAAFAQAALGDALSDATRFAAEAAESRWEGVGLVIASPEFNRR